MWNDQESDERCWICESKRHTTAECPDRAIYEAEFEDESALRESLYDIAEGLEP